MPTSVKKPSEKYRKLKDKVTLKRKNLWFDWTLTTQKAAFAFAEGYKSFVQGAKTERLCVDYAEQLLRKKGFKELATIKSGTAKPGTKFFTTFRNKVVCAGIIGKKGISDGLSLVLTHIDSPRLDLKPYPLYEDESIALLKTHYYGGVKKYQWASIPLEIHGTVTRADGKTIAIHYGDKPNQPAFYICDLLPHYAREQMDRKAKDTIRGEELNVVVGTLPIPDEHTRDAIKLSVLEFLNNEYGIIEEDLISSEITLTPSIPVRDIGFDRGMIAAYGHDDRSCSYSALEALLNAKASAKTQIVVWVDREEIGSTGDTGAESDILRYFFGKVARLVQKNIAEEELKEMFYRSVAISGDVSPVLDPTFKSVAETRNAPRVNQGIVMHRYSGHGGKYRTSEASAEFTGIVRKIFNDAAVPWQSGELGKIDEGGGGTIAQFVNNHGIQIIDCGPGVLNMHAPYELISKGDLYATYLAYKAFLEKA